VVTLNHIVCSDSTIDLSKKYGLQRVYMPYRLWCRPEKAHLLTNCFTFKVCFSFAVVATDVNCLCSCGSIDGSFKVNMHCTICISGLHHPSINQSWRVAISRSLPPLRSFARTVCPPLPAGPQSLIHPCHGRSGEPRW